MVELKALGIVRRVDPFGYVRMPKAVCEALGLRPGSLVQVMLTGDGGVYLRPLRRGAW